MTPNPIVLAARAKGGAAFLRRASSISRRYGFSTAQMDGVLERFSALLRRYNCGATFPVTAVALKRHSGVIAKYAGQHIEFAIHGYTHVDYSRLEPALQLAHLQQAREVFSRAGIAPAGFRSPYLSRDEHLTEALRSTGFTYVSNQPFLWDVLDQGLLPPSALRDYQRAVDFYQPWQGRDRLSIPQQADGLVEIPVSLPDDEILIERLGAGSGLICDTWLRILAQTHARGELFTLQLHPERFDPCAEGLSAVLAEARSLTPQVWCARLEEIAAWWKARAEARVEISQGDGDEYRLDVIGPSGITILCRLVDIDAPVQAWADGYHEVKATRFALRSPIRPWIGVSPSTPGELSIFLRQQGYIVETSGDPERYTFFIDQQKFDAGRERIVIDHIEKSNCPLIKLGYWPDSAKSALSITGDIDALTLWDYGLRLIGR